jgi:hypothetical protein
MRGRRDLRAARPSHLADAAVAVEDQPPEPLPLLGVVATVCHIPQATARALATIKTSPPRELADGGSIRASPCPQPATRRTKPSRCLHRQERLVALRASSRLRKLDLPLEPSRTVGALTVDAQSPFATPFAEARATPGADENSHRLDSGASGPRRRTRFDSGPSSRETPKRRVFLSKSDRGTVHGRLVKKGPCPRRQPPKNLR